MLFSSKPLRFLAGAFALTAIFGGCKTTKQAQLAEPITISVDANGNTIAGGAVPKWAPKKHSYKPSRTLYQDLLHTRLEVSFDWNQAYLLGKANLKLKPYFYPTDSLILDAKGFKVNEVAIVKNSAKTPLKYVYNDQQLKIQLDKQYTRDETYEIFIDYVARPNELKDPKGSAAITDAKGLYFINPKNEVPDKPRQLWTQGETEANSCWFPTIESGAERCTEELYITVEDSLVTLSNGVLVSSTKNANGTRTDYWKLDTPHTPYLFMMAVGRFAVVKDKWRDRTVDYYVDPPYEQYARMIFGKTPEMIEFFSKRLGVDYMWPKYSQIIVRDYVSGAMENTTAVTFMEEVQQDRREYLDESHEDIVAHELFHHWFGDYVTCESWANLPLNESFASYGEYLWFEFKYGKDRADKHIDNDLAAYLGEAEDKREPLIRYYHDHREDMFDRHSYQKGACTLHMLRKYLGDDAFFNGLKLYLTRNALTGVEIDELRIAYEDLTGEDLNWFFDQWFKSAGHPELKIFYRYNASSQQAEIEVKQLQDRRYQPLYKLPTQIEITVGGQSKVYPIVFSTVDSVFRYPVASAPENMQFDPQKVLLGDFSEEKPTTYWIYQAKNAANYKMRQVAIRNLVEDKNKFGNDKDVIVNLLLELAKNPFWAVRQDALDGLMMTGEAKLEAFGGLVRDIVQTDPEAPLRLLALEMLDSTNLSADQKMLVYQRALMDSSYSVCGKALKSLVLLDKNAAKAFANRIQGQQSKKIIGAIAYVFIQADEPQALEYAQKTINKMQPNWDKINLIRLLSDYLSYTKDAVKQSAGIDFLRNVAANDRVWYVRYWACYALHENHGSRPEIQTFLEQRKRDDPEARVREGLAKNLK